MVLSISLWRVPVAPEVPTSLGLFVQLRAQQFCAFPLLGGWAASALRPCGESLGSCAGGWSSLSPRCSAAVGPVWDPLCWGAQPFLDPPAACGARPGSCPACLVVQCAGGPPFVGCSPGLRIEPLALRGALSCHGPEGLRYWWWGGMPHSPAQPIADAPCAKRVPLF